ncbi:MAG: hypothetical protein IPH31_18105 [Lewinellaceae bacterium]|nr:hypothetical protein [Lewinellaceae bacterium]
MSGTPPPFFRAVADGHGHLTLRGHLGRYMVFQVAAYFHQVYRNRRCCRRRGRTGRLQGETEGTTPTAPLLAFEAVFIGLTGEDLDFVANCCARFWLVSCAPPILLRPVYHSDRHR